jgi:hypothetical protein
MKAPPLAGSPRVNDHRDYVVKALLFGVTGPVDGKTYSDVMIPMVRATTSGSRPQLAVRRSFGEQWRVRDDSGCARARGHGRPHGPVDGRRVAVDAASSVVNDGWKATASHNADAAPRALSLTSWNTGVPQQAGMWFQVELPGLCP